MSSWGYEAVFYQIYPLGLCGAPFENDGKQEHRILKVIDWADHIAKLGCNAVYFSPVFESDTHGYNTRDYSKIDCRLGTNEDFKKVCDALHKEFGEKNRGRLSQVLWESDVKDGMMGGYSGNYIRIERPYDPLKVNTIEDIIL